MCIISKQIANVRVPDPNDMRKCQDRLSSEITQLADIQAFYCTLRYNIRTTGSDTVVRQLILNPDDTIRNNGFHVVFQYGTTYLSLDPDYDEYGDVSLNESAWKTTWFDPSITMQVLHIAFAMIVPSRRLYEESRSIDLGDGYIDTNTIHATFSEMFESFVNKRIQDITFLIGERHRLYRILTEPIESVVQSLQAVVDRKPETTVFVPEKIDVTVDDRTITAPDTSDESIRRVLYALATSKKGSHETYE